MAESTGQPIEVALLLTDLSRAPLEGVASSETANDGDQREFVGSAQGDDRAVFQYRGCDLVVIDQSPIGRTPRSNPVTYIKTFDEIRKLFAKTPEIEK